MKWRCMATAIMKKKQNLLCNFIEFSIQKICNMKLKAI